MKRRSVLQGLLALVALPGAMRRLLTAPRAAQTPSVSLFDVTPATYDYWTLTEVDRQAGVLTFSKLKAHVDAALRQDWDSAWRAN